jgi:MFS family permease
MKQHALLRTIGHRASFQVAAAVVSHTLWTNAAPAVTYPLYAAKWNHSLTVTSAIFAIYPIVVVAVLIGFGDISDYIGRRATTLLGLGSSLLACCSLPLRQASLGSLSVASHGNRRWLVGEPRDRRHG